VGRWRVSVTQLRDNVLFKKLLFVDDGVEKRYISLCMSPYEEVLSVSISEKFEDDICQKLTFILLIL